MAAAGRPGYGPDLRQALGDALWHSKAGIPLNDHRTPPQWADDLAARFSALGIDSRDTTRSCSADHTRTRIVETP
jgi:hypothetical protein